MIKNKKYLFLLVIIGFTINLYGQTTYKIVKNQNTIAAKLTQVSQNTSSIKSNFVQFKHLSILENNIESKGIFRYKNPDKVRWEYKTPYSYIIIMNSSVMKIKDGNKLQTYNTESNKVFKEINDLMVGVMSGNILQSKDFDLTIKENNTNYLVEMYPKDSDLSNMLNVIHMYFRKKDYSVSEIKMIEGSEDYTQIIFKNRETNGPIPNSQFMFK